MARDRERFGMDESMLEGRKGKGKEHADEETRVEIFGARNVFCRRLNKTPVRQLAP